MVQFEIKIEGRVQGVGFRFFAQKVADEFGVKGWVKNTNDGGVLVMAQGNETDVSTFIDYLSTGPVLSRVDKLSKVKMNSLENFSDFRVQF